MQRDIDKEFVLNRADPLYILNTDKAKTEIEAAALVELPYQSVIPVIVPGAPEQHIGYFILVDQWGEPINPDNRDMNDINANSRLVESNMHARFGVPSSLIVGDRSPLEHFKVTSSIFGNNSGETMVEVLVAFTLLSIMLVIFSEVFFFYL